MISHLHGTVEHVAPGSLVIDIGGIGFHLAVPATLSSTAVAGQTLKVSTSLVMRQDQLSLYGFASAQERELFGMLTSISGIGPRTALSVLSTMRPGELAAAILEENTKALTAVPGIGNRTAKRLIVELSEKIAGLAPEPVGDHGESLGEDAVSVLKSLGCTDEEAETAVRSAVDRVGEGAGVERLVMEALRILGESGQETAVPL